MSTAILAAESAAFAGFRTISNEPDWREGFEKRLNEVASGGAERLALAAQNLLDEFKRTVQAREARGYVNETERAWINDFGQKLDTYAQAEASAEHLSRFLPVVGPVRDLVAEFLATAPGSEEEDQAMQTMTKEIAKNVKKFPAVGFLKGYPGYAQLLFKKIKDAHELFEGDLSYPAVAAATSRLNVLADQLEQEYNPLLDETASLMEQAIAKLEKMDAKEKTQRNI